MGRLHIHPAFIAFGTPTSDLDEIECSLYALPTWRLVHRTLGRVEIPNHPAYLTTLLMLLEAGYEHDNEMSTIGYAAPATTDAANAHSDHDNGNEE